ncbi:DUF3927 domain-containing protein [Mitsuokella multacida]|uniref:DUF3927 domain-containing protein n=1 Tax=Mitsuokella multacida TaxID=52226 RepID=A0A414NWA6_9FIRM|nr:DUF3927 domain-containing protein [Mitsuokella multacida]
MLKYKVQSYCFCEGL